jgi:large subunit ribosomal protein L6
MSRIGKKPITIPDKIKITYKDRIITVQGDKGTLSREVHPTMDLEIDDQQIKVKILTEDKKHLPKQGLMRSLIANMIEGVDKGFERVLEINGIGYRAEVKSNSMILNLGYSQPVDFKLPEGITAKVDKNTIIKLSGIDKEKLGQTAASIRRLRPPEPYKGKGIKYAEEHIKRKAGKAGTK